MRNETKIATNTLAYEDSFSRKMIEDLSSKLD